MELSQWEQLSFELANHLVYTASQTLANRRLSNEEKMRALRLMAGLSWNKKATAHMQCGKLSVMAQ